MIKAAAIKGLKGHLAAWDPVAQKEVWRVDVSHPWNGGTLATAGHVVYEGDAMGKFSAYHDADGKLLWSVQTGTGILAPPISYAVAGKQYIAVETGWGGAFALSAGELALKSQIDRGNIPRVIVFSLDGTDTIPAAAAGRHRRAYGAAGAGQCGADRAGQAAVPHLLQQLSRRYRGQRRRAAGPALFGGAAR